MTVALIAILALMPKETNHALQERKTSPERGQDCTVPVIRLACRGDSLRCEGGQRLLQWTPSGYGSQRPDAEPEGVPAPGRCTVGSAVRSTGHVRRITVGELSSSLHRAAYLEGVTLKRGDGDALIRIAWLESRLDPECRTGQHYGLWQIATRVHHVKPPMSVLDQCRWAIRYVYARYHGPRQALAYGSRHGSRNHGWRGF